MSLSWTFVYTLAVSTLLVEECNGFALPPVVPPRNLPRFSSFHERRPWSPGRRRNAHFSQDHEALSVPISGAISDSTNSWEEIVNPHYVSEATHESITVFDKVVIGGTIIAAAFSLYGIIFLTAPGAWRYFCAGGICAATSHAIPTPIDVIKVSQLLTEIVSFHSDVTHISPDEETSRSLIGR